MKKLLITLIIIMGIGTIGFVIGAIWINDSDIQVRLAATALLFGLTGISLGIVAEGIE